eukprot:9468286-Pyramimonas_sp.AAC.1
MSAVCPRSPLPGGSADDIVRYQSIGKLYKVWDRTFKMECLNPAHTKCSCMVNFSWHPAVAVAGGGGADMRRAKAVGGGSKRRRSMAIATASSATKATSALDEQR